MNCKEAIDYIHSLERFGIMPGLERISVLCEALGNPQNDVKFIHVAGTNGKGSTCTMIANILQSAGYKTGLYTSPYVVDFRERIQLNGNMIEPDELACCIENVRSVYESKMLPFGLVITEFEAVTAAAFLYFSRIKCDYVVLEVGLGGKFDATNIISSPEACCIAYIGLDHTAVLGDTIEKIAAEKCGIIKNNVPVITYPLQRDKAIDVISDICNEKKCKLVIPDIDGVEIISRSIKGTLVRYKQYEYRIPLAGEHIVYNSLVAFECCREIGIPICSVINGIENTVMPARMELISDNPVTILDGGHNEDCANALKNYILANFKNKRIIMVMSIMADKDYDSYLCIAAPLADCFIATQAEIPRALDCDKLMKDASRYCFDCYSIKNSLEAINYAFDTACLDDIVIICGSFYLAGEVRNYILKNKK